LFVLHQSFVKVIAPTLLQYNSFVLKFQCCCLPRVILNYLFFSCRGQRVCSMSRTRKT